jgi:hypothetical protein
MAKVSIGNTRSLSETPGVLILIFSEIHAPVKHSSAPSRALKRWIFSGQKSIMESAFQPAECLLYPILLAG